MWWHNQPVFCGFCGRPNKGDSVQNGQHVAWCKHCHEVFEVTALRVPGWVTGVTALLLILSQ